MEWKKESEERQRSFSAAAALEIFHGFSLDQLQPSSTQVFVARDQSAPVLLRGGRETRGREVPLKCNGGNKADIQGAAASPKQDQRRCSSGCGSIRTWWDFQNEEG